MTPSAFSPITVLFVLATVLANARPTFAVQDDKKEHPSEVEQRISDFFAWCSDVDQQFLVIASCVSSSRPEAEEASSENTRLAHFRVIQNNHGKDRRVDVIEKFVDHGDLAYHYLKTTDGRIGATQRVNKGPRLWKFREEKEMLNFRLPPLPYSPMQPIQQLGVLAMQRADGTFDAQFPSTVSKWRLLREDKFSDGRHSGVFLNGNGRMLIKITFLEKPNYAIESVDHFRNPETPIVDGDVNLESALAWPKLAVTRTQWEMNEIGLLLPKRVVAWQLNDPEGDGLFGLSEVETIFHEWRKGGDVDERLFDLSNFTKERLVEDCDFNDWESRYMAFVDEKGVTTNP